MEFTDVQTAVELLLHIIAWATLISVVLPPVEVFDQFPGFKRWYKLLVDIVEYIALNIRGKIAKAYNERRNGN